MAAVLSRQEFEYLDGSNRLKQIWLRDAVLLQSLFHTKFSLISVDFSKSHAKKQKKCFFSQYNVLSVNAHRVSLRLALGLGLALRIGIWIGLGLGLALALRIGIWIGLG